MNSCVNPRSLRKSLHYIALFLTDFDIFTCMTISGHTKCFLISQIKPILEEN